MHGIQHVERLHMLVVGLHFTTSGMFSVPPLVFDVLIQMKHEHWEAYHVRTMY
jgi:hypothetical protein